MTLRCQLLHRPIAPGLLMQRQQGLGEAWVAQRRHQAGRIPARTFNPTPNNHGRHHVRQARQYAGEADAGAADFTLHGRQDRHQPRITLALGVDQHQVRHQAAKAVQTPQFKLHAAAEEQGALSHACIGAGIHGTHRIAEDCGVEAVDVLHRHLRAGEQLMGAPVGDEHGVARRQFVLRAVLGTQGDAAGGDKVEVRMPGFGRKAQAKRRPGLDTAVLDAPQAHAAQQLVDEVRGHVERFCGHHFRGFGKEFKILHHRSSCPAYLDWRSR